LSPLVGPALCVGIDSHDCGYTHRSVDGIYGHARMGLLPDRCNVITSSAPFHHLQGKPIYLLHTHGDAHVYMHSLQLPPTGVA